MLGLMPNIMAVIIIDEFSMQVYNLKAVAIKLIKFRHFCVYCKIQTS